MEEGEAYSLDNTRVNRRRSATRNNRRVNIESYETNLQHRNRDNQRRSGRTNRIMDIGQNERIPIINLDEIQADAGSFLELDIAPIMLAQPQSEHVNIIESNSSAERPFNLDTTTPLSVRGLRVVISSAQLAQADDNAEWRQNLPDPVLHVGPNLNSNNIDVVDIDTPSKKKRKRRSKSKTLQDSKLNVRALTDEDDDGSTCLICCERYEMSGSHRLTSLKCGHLFGDSCIKRWLAQCVANQKRSCPFCKSKAEFRDLRYIYAKRIAVADNTEEVRLKEALDTEKSRYIKLQTEHELMTLELKTIKVQVNKLESDIERMRRISLANNSSASVASNEKPIKYLFDHKMHMTKNIEISKEPGCRCMIYSAVGRNLLVSQKSNQNLFPGFGVKLIDVNSDFRPTTFLHTSIKPLRDLCLSAGEDLLVCASQEKMVKIFDINNRAVTSTITPSEKDIWSCAMDRNQRSNFLYLGSQHGSTYIYDIRNTNQLLEETSIAGDTSPVINIFPLPISNNFPLGGFLICKLQTLWFYEFMPAQKLNATKLAVDGPFLSMHYNSFTDTILITTRVSAKCPRSKYILGKIIKVNNLVVFNVELELFGSRAILVMSRSTQFPIKDNSLVAAYIQDSKQLTLWNVGESSKIQSLACSDTVYDICPVFNNGDEGTYLAALTEMKCRIYKIESTLK